MTRDVLVTAVREGIPFVIGMADGEKYEVLIEIESLSVRPVQG